MPFVDGESDEQLLAEFPALVLPAAVSDVLSHVGVRQRDSADHEHLKRVLDYLRSVLRFAFHRCLSHAFFLCLINAASQTDQSCRSDVQTPVVQIALPLPPHLARDAARTESLSD